MSPDVNGGRVVLHVEDRRENRLLVRKLLERSGFTVVDAADGLTGIELAAECSPVLILVDINIPGLDGYEVVTKLRGMSALDAVPVVAITAEGDRERSLALGFDGFISKPIRIATFVRQIEDFLGGKREAADGATKSAHIVAHSRQLVDHLESQIRALTHANARLQEVDRLKMEVFRNVSHELATPMTPLLGYVRMLVTEELGPLADPQKNVLRRMGGSLERLAGLIDNLLNVTRFATGSVALDRSLVDAKALAEEVVAGRQPYADSRGVQIDLAIDGALEPIIVDRARLLDALRQVLDNAIKFGPDGSRVRIEMRVEVDADGDRRLLEVIIDDEGPGIPAGERERVLEPFYQIDGSETRRHGGAGLGLAVAHQASELHGGSLRVESAPSGGARIRLRIATRPTQ